MTINFSFLFILGLKLPKPKKERIIDVCQPRTLLDKENNIKLKFYNFNDDERKYCKVGLENIDNCILINLIKKQLANSNDNEFIVNYFIVKFLKPCIELFEEWMRKFKDGELTLNEINEFLTLTGGKEESRIKEFHKFEKYYNNLDAKIDKKTIEFIKKKVNNYHNSRKLLTVLKKLSEIKKVRKFTGDFTELFELTDKVS